MNYILEALIIGLYSLTVYIPINLVSKDLYTKFFFTGFFKHFLGYFIGIHNLYCRFHELELKKVKLLTLFLESILEGFVFLIFGIFLTKMLHESKTISLAIFIIGFVLHIVLEMLGIHNSFLHNKCTKKS